MRQEKSRKIRKIINKIITTAAVIASAVCFLSSCEDNMLYFSYQPVDKGRWEKTDGLCFEIPSQQYEGRCNSFVVLRTDDRYPYRNLSVFVESRRNDSTRVKRVDFDLKDLEAKGIRHKDYIMPLNTFDISKDDTLHLRISHNMRDNILEGVTDVGIKVMRCSSK